MPADVVPVQHDIRNVTGCLQFVICDSGILCTHLKAHTTQAAAPVVTLALYLCQHA